MSPSGANRAQDDAEVINVCEATLESGRRAGSTLVLAPTRRLMLEDLRKTRIWNGVIVVGEGNAMEVKNEEVKIHTPDEIAARVGQITVKTLSALIRSRGLETTTLGHAPPSKRGGPPRRLWGMTDAQLERLLALRKR
jgi:hypothetical protein